MNKKIPVIIGGIILLALGIYLLTRGGAPADLTVDEMPVQTATTTTPTDAEPAATPEAESASVVKNKAWVVFQNYLAFAKDHNISGLKSVTYKLSEACQDKDQQSECNIRMDNAYQGGSKFKEGDFKHVWFDDKQIVLFTDWRIEESETALGYGREMIYFVRTADGTPKLLFFTLPTQISYTSKREGATREDLIERLEEMVKDDDRDTADNELEQCINIGEGCIKTDPTKRDSDGDGYWDGLELFMR